MNNQPITRHLVPEAERMDTVDKLFGIKYILKLEPTVFSFAEHLAAPAYSGGYWHFYSLSNGAFYMAPRPDSHFAVGCDNGFEGLLSAEALGIVACLYTYSNLSFGDDLTGTDAFAQVCAEQYHLLRAYIFGHAEVRSIFRAID